MKTGFISFATMLAIALAGCARVSVDPIEVKPIHIVHDINIRVDRQLDEFFAFQNQPTTQPSPTTAPTAQGVTQ